MKIIEDVTINYIAKQKLCVLRKRNGMAIDVSYSEDGLKLSCAKNGKLYYYQNAFLKGVTPYSKHPKGLEKDPNVYVELFVPKSYENSGRGTEKLQAAEYAAVHKAYKLSYQQRDSQHSW